MRKGCGSSLFNQVLDVAFRTSNAVPEIILVSPPPILRDLRAWQKVFEGGFQKSRDLASEYADVAKAQGIGILNAGEHASCSPIDGFHIDKTGARSLGMVLGELIRSCVSSNLSSNYRAKSVPPKPGRLTSNRGGRCQSTSPLWP